MRRRIRGRPNSPYFKPAGIRTIELEEVVLTLDEFEAIRLKDHLKYDQNKCSEEMHISQPTFHRILQAAHEKIADALVKGKALRIEKKQ